MIYEYDRWRATYTPRSFSFAPLLSQIRSHLTAAPPRDHPLALATLLDLVLIPLLLPLPLPLLLRDLELTARVSVTLGLNCTDADPRLSTSTSNSTCPRVIILIIARIWVDARAPPQLAPSPHPQRPPHLHPSRALLPRPTRLTFLPIITIIVPIPTLTPIPIRTGIHTPQPQLHVRPTLMKTGIPATFRTHTHMRGE